MHSTLIPCNSRSYCQMRRQHLIPASWMKPNLNYVRLPLKGIILRGSLFVGPTH